MYSVIVRCRLAFILVLKSVKVYNITVRGVMLLYVYGISVDIMLSSGYWLTCRIIENEHCTRRDNGNII
jgi:hypothetical protein